MRPSPHALPEESNRRAVWRPTQAAGVCPRYARGVHRHGSSAQPESRSPRYARGVSSPPGRDWSSVCPRKPAPDQSGCCSRAPLAELARVRAGARKIAACSANCPKPWRRLRPRGGGGCGGAPGLAHQSSPTSAGGAATTVPCACCERSCCIMQPMARHNWPMAVPRSFRAAARRPASRCWLKLVQSML